MVRRILPYLPEKLRGRKKTVHLIRWRLGTGGKWNRIASLVDRTPPDIHVQSTAIIVEQKVANEYVVPIGSHRCVDRRHDGGIVLTLPTATTVVDQAQDAHDGPSRRSVATCEERRQGEAQEATSSPWLYMQSWPTSHRSRS
jgi:hypothetical protein